MADLENTPYLAGSSYEQMSAHAEKVLNRLKSSPEYENMSFDDRNLAMNNAIRQSYIRSKIYLDADSLLRQIHHTRSNGDKHF